MKLIRFGAIGNEKPGILGDDGKRYDCSGQFSDWEVELGIVIGKDGRYLDSIDDADAHIAGYCISHDVSERTFQLERGGLGEQRYTCSGIKNSFMENLFDAWQ